MTHADLPPRWRIAMLADVAAHRQHALVIGPFGSDLKTSDYCDDGVPIVFVRDVQPNCFSPKQRRYLSVRKAAELDAHAVRPGDLVITKMGLPPCVAAVFPETEMPGIVTADIIKLSIDESVANRDYVARFLNSELAKSQIAAITFGITRPKVTLRDFKKVWLPLPPLEDQRRIAEVLDRAEVLRAKRRAALAELDTLTQALFLDIFGDPAMNLKGWATSVLGDVATFVGGGTPSRARPEYFTGSICWATSKDIKSEFLDDTEEHITEGAIGSSATKLVPAGTILVVVKSKILVHHLPVAVARVSTRFGQDLKGIRLDNRCEVSYVATALRLGKRWLLERARGINTEGLTLDHLRAFPLAIPPLSLQSEFARRATVVERLKEAHRASLAELDALFSPSSTVPSGGSCEASGFTPRLTITNAIAVGPGRNPIPALATSTPSWGQGNLPRRRGLDRETNESCWSRISVARATEIRLSELRQVLPSGSGSGITRELLGECRARAV